VESQPPEREPVIEAQSECDVCWDENITPDANSVPEREPAIEAQSECDVCWDENITPDAG
jgi:hypothetical protein